MKSSTLFDASRSAKPSLGPFCKPLLTNATAPKLLSWLAIVPDKLTDPSAVSRAGIPRVTLSGSAHSPSRPGCRAQWSSRSDRCPPGLQAR
eukprot:7384222-Prymnesium_polylepis.7